VRRLKIFFHDACFDGTASAALFGSFYRAVVGPAELILAPMHHSEYDPFADVSIDGDDNACVDFRFCADPSMRWWFDHHKTAFQPPALREIFDGGGADTWFFDPDAPSCAGLIARVAAEKWGWKPPPALAEVVRWADVIDAARFASAAEATSLASPAQQLALWLGAAARPDEIARYVRGLSDGASLDELVATVARDGIVASRDVRAHQRELIARSGQWHGDVVALDLSDDSAALSPGFVGYELYPSCRYTVALTRSPRAVKIAVGWNPWGPPRRHDVGSLCERFGGGGHAAVGGVTLSPNEVDRGRAVVASIVEELAR
jgi:hypothetical protein